jgi:hypothetical protein
MKSITHNVFSLGLELLAASTAHIFLPGSLLMAAWIALAVNYFIDFAGHRRRGDRSIRSWITHSVFTAPLWGAAIGLFTVFVYTRLFQATVGFELYPFSAVLGFLAGYSHLFLDSLTEGGVFLGRTRIAISHFGNNGILLNSVFVGMGVLLGVAAVAALG